MGIYRPHLNAYSKFLAFPVVDVAPFLGELNDALDEALEAMGAG